MSDRGEPLSALVTGAASGLGRACAVALRGRGYRVAGLDLDVDAIATDISMACDVADVHAVSAAVSRVTAEWGGLDVVAHCAAMFPPSAVPVHALDPAIWRRTIDVNLTGAYAVSRAVLPSLLKTRGAMVLVASTAGSLPQPGGAVYAASKAGVAGLARAMAVEYAHMGVRVNAVSPGWMDTAMAAPVLGRAALRARVEQRIPMGRVAAPAEVAAVVAWLLSEDAGYVTGQDLVVDAGMGLMAFVNDGDVAATWQRVGTDQVGG